MAGRFDEPEVAQHATGGKKKVAQHKTFSFNPPPMNVNENVKALILQGLRKKKQTKVWLAEKMGLNKSWATRLLNGQLKTLSDEHAEKLMEILDIEFFTLRRVDDSTVSNPSLSAIFIKCSTGCFRKVSVITKIAQAVFLLSFSIGLGRLRHSLRAFSVVRKDRYLTTQDR